MRTRLTYFTLALIGLLVAAPSASAQTERNGISTDEVLERRSHLQAAHSDGLILLMANGTEKAMEQPAWIQSPAFQYFTLLDDVPGAILLVDAPRNQSILFAPPAPRSFGLPIEALNLMTEERFVIRSGVDAVLPMDRMLPYIQERLTSGVSTIYLDEPRRDPPRQSPEDMLAVSGTHRLWKQSLSQALPTAHFESAASIISKMRWAKSPAEVAILEKNGAHSANALKVGMLAIEAGRTQREAEAAVVSACLTDGAEGPSFWPWVMGGPNAHMSELVRSFFDPSNMNRVYQSGELVRVDIGCMSMGYGGDVGRTVPVSGQFSTEQRQIWDLLVVGYQAGVDAMKDGVSIEDVKEASRNAIRSAAHFSSELAQFAEVMAAADGVDWHLHGIGIESGETPGEPVLRAGSVLAYEPMFVWREDAFYLEDMWLVTSSGTRLLTPDLPTTSQEIESFLSPSNR